MKLAASVFAILLAPTVAQVPSVAAPSQPKAPLNATGSQRKFADMRALERYAILTEIEKQDLPAIFKAMLDAERVEHDPMKQMDLQTVLADAMKQKKSSPEFLDQMRTFLADSSNSNFERQLLIGALEDAATKETVDLLIRVAATSPEQKIRESAGSLAGVGAGGRGGPELSPALERLWRESSDPNHLLSAASAMAKIGTPSGIELLLSAALATEGRDKARHDAAQYALPQVHLPNAVPPLAARLASQPPTSEAVKLVAPILARIGDATASKAVVGWLQGRSEDAAPLIHDYIVQWMLGSPMESAWAAALDPAVPFRNEENRKAIREALDAYRAGRTSVPPK